ncbi:MAG: aldose 1-epimerase family protein, partial [Lachnospiraceae bacterium]
MIIEIQSSCAKAQIDSYGAQLISLIDKEGTEYIWQREPSLWDNCSPILFPIIGNSRNNITIVEGTPLEIPKHGYCKTSSFEVTEQSSNRVVFSFDDTAVPAGG